MDRGRTIEVNAILEAPAALPARGVDADALFDNALTPSCTASPGVNCTARDPGPGLA
jgi:hypothetical protein